MAEGYENMFDTTAAKSRKPPVRATGPKQRVRQTKFLEDRYYHIFRSMGMDIPKARLHARYAVIVSEIIMAGAGVLALTYLTPLELLFTPTAET